MALLLFYVGLALSVSFFCSLLEAALLSARFGRLTQQAAAGSRGAGLLLEIKRERVDDAISAILIFNTLANTLGATLAGAQAAILFGPYVGIFSGVLTLLILVISEIIPKTLGTVYVGPLAGFVGWSLHGLTRLLRPGLVLSRMLTRLLTRGRPLAVSRGELAAIIATASRDGAISREESTMFANLLRFNEVRVEDVMTPRTVLFMLQQQSTIRELLDNREVETFSRIPVFGEDRDQVVGYVLVRDVLHAAIGGADPATPLAQFRREIAVIPEKVSVGRALRQFLERREPLAVVTDEHGGVSGLVTLEDLTETILGSEIVDESDRIVDLQAAAVDLRERRLERMRRKRAVLVGTPPADPGSGG